MGERIMKTILALVMIVAGLTGFLWEFTVVDNDMYTIVDTHYGNRIECHIESIGDVDTLGKIGGKNADEAVRKMLAGKVWWSDAFYSLKNKEYCVPGIEWLIEPILPEGISSGGMDWTPEFCSFSIAINGQYRGVVISCDEDFTDFQGYLKSHEQRTADGEVPGRYYSIGDTKVFRDVRHVTFVGTRNGFCYIGLLNILDGETITDDQIAEFGLRYALPRSWEVTLLVLVNVLRGVCLATAVAGIVLLVLPALKRKRAVSVTEHNS